VSEPVEEARHRSARQRGAARAVSKPGTTVTGVPGDLLVHLRRAHDHADRHYTEPLDLETLAGIAGLSKHHFQRLFTATYGHSPAAHVSRRRIERAQDLLRATNLTVTEVCHAVGFSSLGSFSTRFRELVGETPSEFQRRYAAQGAPHIPGCFIFMWGLAETRSASEEKPADRTAS
jgi:transcriptional regulator GlxA family with amidase domain